MSDLISKYDKLKLVENGIVYKYTLVSVSTGKIVVESYVMAYNLVHAIDRIADETNLPIQGDTDLSLIIKRTG